MPLNPVAKDYTGTLQVGGSYVPCTNFQITMNMPMMKSAAVRERIFDGTKFTAHGRAVIREYCVYDVSATFDATNTAFTAIINILKNSPRSGVDVKYTDNAYGVTYDFKSQNTFLTGLSISCSEGSLASMTVSFNVFANSFDVNYAAYSTGKNSSKASWSSSDLIPYWMTTCTYTDIREYNVVSFDFNWTQSVEPMYSCSHNTSASPLEPAKLKFGLPQINFSITYMHHDSINRTAESTEVPNTGTFVIQKGGSNMVSCDNCITTSVAPQMGVSSTYITYQVNGECLGIMS